MHRTYATAQNTGLRDNQCDATAVHTRPDGARAYVLLDGVGDSEHVREWTRTAARRVARAAARRGDAEAGLRAVYNAYRAERETDYYYRGAKAAAVVAVTAPGRPLTVAWCGDARAYVLVRGGAHCLTRDHNQRRVFGGSRNVITSTLGASDTDDEVKNVWGHPAIESVTRVAEDCRLLLASDGAYEPHEDSTAPLCDRLPGELRDVARHFVNSAVLLSKYASADDPYGAYADNATALVADLRP